MVVMMMMMMVMVITTLVVMMMMMMMVVMIMIMFKTIWADLTSARHGKCWKPPQNTNLPASEVVPTNLCSTVEQWSSMEQWSSTQLIVKKNPPAEASEGQGRPKEGLSKVYTLQLLLWSEGGQNKAPMKYFFLPKKYFFLPKSKRIRWQANFYVYILRPRIGAAGCVCKVTNWSHFLERGPRPRCLHKRTVNFRISSNCHQGFLFYSPKILPLSDFLHISRMICRCQRYNWQNIGYNFSSQDDINAYLIFVNLGALLHYLGL